MEHISALNIIGGILFYFAKLIVLIIAYYKCWNSGSILLLTGSIAIVITDITGLLFKYKYKSR